MSNQVIGCTILIVLKIVLLFVALSDTSQNVLIRSRRQLLFTNSTLFQAETENQHCAEALTFSSQKFNVGIGTPTPADHINMNWAFQANFQLPWNRSQIPFDILEANSGYQGDSRKKREADTAVDVIEKDGDYESDAKLYHFYKNVEEFLNGFGQNGTSCVLQTLCQLGRHPLHTTTEDDLLHELASFVLNPKNDASHGVTEKDDAYRYIDAYKNGETGEDCTKAYTGCTTPIIDMFTVLSS